ncbi:MAG: Rrf2 family transcriptional regulator [Deltaproteobacteria bacterium]|nr:MAG: Rrf2 family transcriptional regulator [Deltaproteobacteria bacterium]
MSASRGPLDVRRNRGRILSLSVFLLHAMLQVSRRVEYALRAALHLAALPSGEVVPFRDLAEREHAPKDFLAKILRSLVQAGLVQSVRGAGGGFQLARSADEITFLDVIEAADGPVALNDCTPQGDGCQHSMDCGMAHVWHAGEQAMLEVFRRTRLADLLHGGSGIAPSRVPADRPVKPSLNA